MYKKIHFSVSSSEGFGLYAFTFDDEIGVDMECVRAIPEIDDIAELYFTKGERLYFLGLPENEKQKEFFNIWVRKEAVLKAEGSGLNRSMDEFEVVPTIEDIWNLPGNTELSLASTGWVFHDLKPKPGYTAALAMKRPLGQIVYCEWTG